MIRNAKDLSLDQKAVIENLLCRPVLDHETISIRAIAPPILPAGRRRALAAELQNSAAYLRDCGVTVLEKRCSRLEMHYTRSKTAHHQLTQASNLGRALVTVLCKWRLARLERASSCLQLDARASDPDHSPSLPGHIWIHAPNVRNRWLATTGNVED